MSKCPKWANMDEGDRPQIRPQILARVMVTDNVCWCWALARLPPAYTRDAIPADCYGAKILKWKNKTEEGLEGNVVPFILLKVLETYSLQIPTAVQRRVSGDYSILQCDMVSKSSLRDFQIFQIWNLWSSQISCQIPQSIGEISTSISVRNVPGNRKYRVE